MKEELSRPRSLDRLYKGIKNMDEFIDLYKNILIGYKNEAEISGYDCIDIEFE